MIREMCSSRTCRKIAQTIWIPYIMCGFLLLYIIYSPTNHIQIFQRQEIKLDNGVVEQYTTQTKSPIDEQRDHIVMGILSANGKQRFRDTQRKTWIKAMLRMQHILPFKITYKFLLDEPSSESIAENALNHDIVFLNITNHGRAVKFGEKMYIWWKYVHTVYPDALLGGRIDDDAFLCVPQVFYRLDSIKSNNLYYGWRHGQSRQINRDNRVDEMFLFLGRDLMSSISKRHYCGQAKCKNKDDLIDLDFGDTSLAEWLSIYSDKVNFISDNDRIVKCRANSHAIYKKYLKPGFCLKQLVFHKSTYEMMELLQAYNDFAFMEKSRVEQSIKMDDVSERTIISGVSGSIFSGDVVRKVPQISIDKHITLFSYESDSKICDNWAVVTTIHQPSNSVRNIAKRPSWCVVIVADVTTPSEDAYLKSVVNDENKRRVIYLSINRQKTLYPLLSEVIPVKHFGRKNIGYMYAIHRNAKYIWDFDDDNNGVFDLIEIERLTKGESVTVCNDKGSKLFNPYPYFGVSETRVWPRGFPLESIKDNKTIPQICDTKVSVKVGAIQCLANEQPDVDAIYRFTRNVPFNFSATKETHKPFVVPKQTFSPFNAQATLWTSSAFKYMALPISINGRVSDIWRSYIAQYFFYRSDLRLAFSVPYVVQERNIHPISGDFNAELDIYEKVGALFNLVMNMKDDNLVSVYENLYSRNFIEKNDLIFIKVWMETFLKVTGSNV